MPLSSKHHDYAGGLFHEFPYGDIRVRKPTITLDLPWLDNASVGIIPLDLGFWVSSFVLLCVQACINMVVAVIVYHWLLPECDSGDADSDVQSTSSNKPLSIQRRFVLGYGIVLPTLLLGPLFVYSKLIAWPNIALMLCLCGAVPNILTLRVVEAMHGQLPDFCARVPNDDDPERGVSRRMLVLYFSSTLQLLFDQKTKQPVPLTWSRFLGKLSQFVSVFVQTSLLFSVLLSCDYQLFPTKPRHTFGDLFYWGNLANSFCMASLTSLVLDGGCSGLGLLTSLATGYTLEQFSDSPLTQSTSPSDFWGRRWDRPVQSCLRRGCYQPLRQAGTSANMAAFATFAVSGFIHEYVLLSMSLRSNHSYQPAWGNQFVFFLWNGIILSMERSWKRRLTVLKKQQQQQQQQDYKQRAISWEFCMQSCYEALPRPLQTVLVLLTVLPIACLFTDEYIKASFYNDAAWAFPTVVYSGPLFTTTVITT